MPHVRVWRSEAICFSNKTGFLLGMSRTISWFVYDHLFGGGTVQRCSQDHKDIKGPISELFPGLAWILYATSLWTHLYIYWKCFCSLGVCSVPSICQVEQIYANLLQLTAWTIAPIHGVAYLFIVEPGWVSLDNWDTTRSRHGISTMGS